MICPIYFQYFSRSTFFYRSHPPNPQRKYMTPSDLMSPIVPGWKRQKKSLLTKMKLSELIVQLFKGSSHRLKLKAHILNDPLGNSNEVLKSLL